MRRSQQRRPGRLATGILIVLSVAVGCVAAGVALVQTARLSARPVVFLTVGLLVLLVVAGAGVAASTRRRSRSARRWIRATVSLVLLAGYLVAMLVPLTAPASDPAPAPGQQTMSLATGSNLTYVRIPAVGRARATPIVFVHGGPGTPDLRGDSEYFGQLTAAGFDVVVYDQFGSGTSGRADDPRKYTVDRHVADLEGLRRHLGADRIVLIGHSYGARIAASYLARYPQHVARAVFSSPQDLDPEAGGVSLLPALTTGQKLSTIAALARPRILTAYSLLQVRPQAAHNLVGDAEMDGAFEAVYASSRPALHCPGKDPGPRLHGIGFYSNQYLQSPVRRRSADPRPALARTSVPALVIKGSCDYVSWSSAVGYIRTIPRSTLAYLHGAGHNAYQDRPQAYLAEVRAFLTGDRLPIAPYRGTRMPSDYQGPRDTAAAS